MFASKSSNLVAGDANGRIDVFLRDLAAGTTTLVSVDADGSQGDRDSAVPIVSADGDHVAFFSRSKNFPGYCDDGKVGDAEQGVWIKDLSSGVLERIDVDSDGLVPDCVGGVPTGISEDGALVLFNAMGAYDPLDGNGELDTYLRDRAAGTTELESGAAATGVWSDPSPYGSSLSPDGRFVVFQSRDRDVVPGDTNDQVDVFLFDRVTRVTSRVSVGSMDEQSGYTSGVAPIAGSAVSADGRTVVFASGGALDPADGNAADDVYLRERSRTPPTADHYGAGFPGRDGTVPQLEARAPPYRGTAVTIDVTSSSRYYVAAFVFLGLARDDVPTSLGGALLVDPLRRIRARARAVRRLVRRRVFRSTTGRRARRRPAGARARSVGGERGLVQRRARAGPRGLSAADRLRSSS